MRFFKTEKLRNVAENVKAEYLNLDKDASFQQLVKVNLESFIQESKGKKQLLPSVRKEVLSAYGEPFRTANESIARAYDAEYEKKHYAHLNSLLFPEGFMKISGYSPSDIEQLKILDVGAGSNELLRFLHAKFHVPSNRLFGVDISTESKNIIEKDGFSGFVGRLEDLSFPENSFDLIFLSYFIDYDTDQRATFDAAVGLLRPKGRIIFEGLLPCLPHPSIDKDNCITQGGNIEDDTRLLYEALLKQGRNLQKNLSVERIVLSQRYIYNRLGLKKRRSVFIVMKAN